MCGLRPGRRARAVVYEDEHRTARTRTGLPSFDEPITDEAAMPDLLTHLAPAQSSAVGGLGRMGSGGNVVGEGDGQGMGEESDQGMGEESDQGGAAGAPAPPEMRRIDPEALGPDGK